MSALFASGRIVDWVLALTAVEFAALVLWRRRTGRGIAAADLAFSLLAGVCLMLAVRAALVGAWWGWVALCLLAAGIAHLADLRRRWLTG